MSKKKSKSKPKKARKITKLEARKINQLRNSKTEKNPLEGFGSNASYLYAITMKNAPEPKKSWWKKFLDIF